jgi:two-component system NtrC family sensor kinase
MSIRSALLSVILIFGILVTSFVSVITVWSLHKSVWREAQERVNHDLRIVYSQYEGQLSILAKQINEIASETDFNVINLEADLERIRQENSLTLLNVCDSGGIPVAGSYPDLAAEVPFSSDPVLRRALEGVPSWGTVLLDENRLELEGGPALKNAMIVYSSQPEDGPATKSALFWWVAYPIKNENGRVVGLLYGGRSLNYNFSLVDELRKTVTGNEQYNGKPVGTVTIFLNDVRVATNVLRHDRKRAVGTLVSREVKEKVIDGGEPWLDRAWVVDEWYISGYLPLSDPDGSILGMLYVGLLEAPYRAIRNSMIFRITLPVFLVMIAAVTAALFIVRRITLPIEILSQAVSHLRKGNWDYKIKLTPTFHEISNLNRLFTKMQSAIAERDRKLHEKNEILEVTNDKLERANKNYMEMLGFVTHELKSPLAAIQSMISVLVDGLAGDLNEQASGFLVRIKRNAEELQDMVKNYLDLSRVERGEMTANKSEIDFRREVIEPAFEQTTQLFQSRNINLTINAPVNLPVKADPELMRIALINYLTNAAKYGREGGEASLEVKLHTDNVEIQVWNEGAGFTPEEGGMLFKKFSRLRNTNTMDKRGSGLGLFLCTQILELHGGRAWAESEKGKWARFYFSFPYQNKTDRQPSTET